MNGDDVLCSIHDNDVKSVSIFNFQSQPWNGAVMLYSQHWLLDNSKSMLIKLVEPCTCKARAQNTHHNTQLHCS